MNYDYDYYNHKAYDNSIENLYFKNFYSCYPWNTKLKYKTICEN